MACFNCSRLPRIFSFGKSPQTGDGEGERRHVEVGSGTPPGLVLKTPGAGGLFFAEVEKAVGGWKSVEVARWTNQGWPPSLSTLSKSPQMDVHMGAGSKDTGEP